MRLHQTLLLLVAVAVSASAQDKNLPPVAERVAAQNALFHEQYESDLREFPERATSLGDYRYNDKLADRSLDAIIRRNKLDEGFLKRLEAIPTAGFSDQDQLSHDLMVRGLEDRIADFQRKEYEMPISQFGGPHTQLADMPLAQSVSRCQFGTSRNRVPHAKNQTETEWATPLRSRDQARSSSRLPSG